MRILVACEESQRVTIELRNRGHIAYSCDLIACSGGHPEWHIKGDVLPLLNGHCDFTTCNGQIRYVPGKWDMIIAFPPCTHLAVSGARHFEVKRNDGRQYDAIEFFGKILNADCEKIAIENPIGIISGKYIEKWFPELAKKYNLPMKQSQIIQPYEFGHCTKKSTCLWLKGLPKLQPTDIVIPKINTYKKNNGAIVRFGDGLDMSRDEKGKIISWNDPRTAILRSKTYPGIAKAMAAQWTIDKPVPQDNCL